MDFEVERALEARLVAGEDAVVDQAGQCLGFQLVAHGRVGDGGHLRQHGFQRVAAAVEVLEQVALGQRQACAQGQRRFAGLGGDLAPQRACFVQAGEGPVRERAPRAPGLIR